MSKYEPPASLDWDDPLPDQLAERWRQIIQELPDIQEVHIPRWIGFDLRHVSTLQLHIFCDGSSMAYAACGRPSLPAPGIGASGYDTVRKIVSVGPARDTQSWSSRESSFWR